MLPTNPPARAFEPTPPKAPYSSAKGADHLPGLLRTLAMKLNNYISFPEHQEDALALAEPIDMPKDATDLIQTLTKRYAITEMDPDKSLKYFVEMASFFETSLFYPLLRKVREICQRVDRHQLVRPVNEEEKIRQKRRDPTAISKLDKEEETEQARYGRVTALEHQNILWVTMATESIAMAVHQKFLHKVIKARPYGPRLSRLVVELIVKVLYLALPASQSLFKNPTSREYNISILALYETMQKELKENTMAPDPISESLKQAEQAHEQLKRNLQEAAFTGGKIKHYLQAIQIARDQSHINSKEVAIAEALMNAATAQNSIAKNLEDAKKALSRTRANCKVLRQQDDAIDYRFIQMLLYNDNEILKKLASD